MNAAWIFLTGYLALATGAVAQDDPRRITVMGEGVVEARPDMATIRLGVTTEARGAREAIDDNSRAMAGVRARLDGLGIEERDMQTASFSVQPRWSKASYSSGDQKIDGFVVYNMLVVRVRNLDALGEVEMHAIQTSGNCIRNVTADHFAGAAADEIEDPRPVAELLRQWSTDHPEFAFLPR